MAAEYILKVCLMGLVIMSLLKKKPNILIIGIKDFYEVLIDSDI